MQHRFRPVVEILEPRLALCAATLPSADSPLDAAAPIDQAEMAAFGPALPIGGSLASHGITLQHIGQNWTIVASTPEAARLINAPQGVERALDEFLRAEVARDSQSSFAIESVDDLVTDGVSELRIYGYFTIDGVTRAISFRKTGVSSADPLDVDHNGRVEAVDAIMVIDEIDHRIQIGAMGDFPIMFDTDGDGKLTARDALLVINRLPRN